MNKKQLRQWLADGQTERVLDALLVQEHLDAHIREEATLLSARFENMEKQVRLGVLEFADENRERAQINAAVLDLVNNIPEFSGEAAFLGKLKTKIFLGVLAIVLLVLAINKSFDNPSTDMPETTGKTAENSAQTSSAPQEAPGLPAANQPMVPVSSKTNKGRLNVHYRAGETIRLYVKADQACYLRSIFRLADGRLLLLDDNRQVSAAEAGDWLETGPGFRAAEPFGEARLYVFAQTTAFPPIATNTATDGSRFIPGSLDELVKALRKNGLRTGMTETEVQLKTHP